MKMNYLRVKCHFQKQKWEGKVSARLTNATAEQIWPLFKDFFNLHKWFPSLPTCHGIHGNNGEPGSIRYCAGFSIPSSNGDKPTVSWSKERLIAVDHVDQSLRYEIVDSNIGFKSYESTVHVVPGSGSVDGQDGCVIEWFITVDPVDGWTIEDLMRKYEVGLQRMAKKMEDEIVNFQD
ncbi:lachrymatory-factor synthase [Quillaja saponaria]|uniref:Lachrymatory-factor synthase n=1 Tax=Quillaja saponaria TaxID=32244 RepID=A0AAD7LYW0_QUISA|nr:lachrymatory-factor synthase [Quillaja saponaria]